MKLAMMKKYIVHFILLFAAFFLLSMGLSAQQKATSNTDSIVPIRKAFLNPPESARPWVFWFWMSGNVSREGITADLEAMKRVGIGGVLIMDIDLSSMDNTPLGPIKFMSEQWKDFFRFAVQEAKRLGLEVNMTNDAGWTGSGGPWITPEYAMQTVVSSEMPVVGGGEINVVLTQPPTKGDYYRDIAVMAVRNPDLKEVHMMDAHPSLSISTAEGMSGPTFPTDKNPVSLSFLNADKLPSMSVRFDSAYTACVLDLTASGLLLDGWFDAVLQVSDDGKEYKNVKSFLMRNGKNSIVFNLATARWFRIQLVKAYTDQKEFMINNLEIHPRYHIENFAFKSVFSKSGIFGQFGKPNETAPSSVILSPEEVINLTGNMDVNGRLQWNAPAWKWTILRLGHTFTGANNGPSPIEGRGP